MFQIKSPVARRILAHRPFFRRLRPASIWLPYLEHFKANAERMDPTRLEAPRLALEARPHFLRTLQVFQLGETGEGRIASQIREVNSWPVDPEYTESIRLFVAEEGRHAKILGRMVASLGGRTLQHITGHTLFFLARRLIGVRFKLLVLLSAEIIGCQCYGILRRALPCGEFRTALAEIRRDERTHLKFHCHFFHLLLYGPSEYPPAKPGVVQIPEFHGGMRAGRFARLLFDLLFYVTAFASAATVIVDHRRTFTALEIPVLSVARGFWRRIAQSKRYIVGGAYWPLPFKTGAPERKG